jgi:alpha-galactosidase
MKKVFFLLVLLAGAFVSQAQKFENLAMTPPMGWNSWNKFACNVSEKLIMETADAMVSSGMKDAGYQYIVIDDCWQVGRDSAGFIIADPERFPSGMKALADYIHSKGLKFGIYSCAGLKTCGGRPGSRGHEFQDAIQYARWGVDYLKYDWCFTEGQTARESYGLMSQALKDAGHPIVFSLCEWGNNKPWEWAANVGHLWRSTGDIFDCFDCSFNQGTWTAWGAMKILDMQEGLRSYAGPGHWNDPDMLEVGVGKLTTSENRAHFSMWCMLAAPLITGNDLRSMAAEVHDILTNREVISVNQDPLGIQGMKYKSENRFETWLKPLTDGRWALCFLNRSEEVKPVNFFWEQNIVEDTVANRKFDAASELFSMKDVWTGKEMGNTKKPLVASVPPHDVLMIILNPLKK